MFMAVISYNYRTCICQELVLPEVTLSWDFQGLQEAVTSTRDLRQTSQACTTGQPDKARSWLCSWEKHGHKKRGRVPSQLECRRSDMQGLVLTGANDHPHVFCFDTSQYLSLISINSGVFSVFYRTNCYLFPPLQQGYPREQCGNRSTRDNFARYIRNRFPR